MQIAASGGLPSLLQHVVLSKHNVKIPTEAPRVLCDVACGLKRSVQRR